ncbi:hypothetical protein LTR78_009232 [Recurvomyces mirabilis]|uniref:Cytochrome P450 n=1 Tax=Recurvomyces mirabilis TaxID=574656 RepID=A0AAE0TQ22_9PEZI|nr:hypothetical protein LTR78_009232 [Recurvomyces mirabilis]KAK5155608.1 hypothetical protein LTS14_005869 [Recurvomyces mirabilis]
MSLAAAAAALLGVASHVLYFRHGEHHMLFMRYAQIFIGTVILSVLALTRLANETISTAVATTGLLTSSYVLGLLVSLFTYRLFLNPSSKFPGPWQMKLSSLYFMFTTDIYSCYTKMDALHQKYGPFVRIGSNDISIIDPNVMDVAFGQHAKASKAEWYDGPKPLDSLHTVRDRAMHDRRRRIWAPGFSDKALRGYEEKVQVFNDKLVQRVREHLGGPTNMTKWFNLYSFDVMGQLSFGKNYGMLDSGERHWALDLLVEGMSASPPKPPVWFFRLMLAIPGLAAGYHKFVAFCKSELKSRVDDKHDDKDVTGWLLRDHEGRPHPEENDELQADVRLIIVAGSDTTSACLTFLFYHLAQHPEEVQKIRDELRRLTRGEWSDVDIKNAQHLNGAINESLRMHPPVPSGLERVTNKEGMQVGDTYVPPGVHFWVPMYSMGRQERVYERSLDFVPERWYSKPEMVKYKDAFAPFSMGPYNCIGKNLAYVEMRTLTAQLVLNFDVKLAPGEDGTRLLTKTKDHFTVSPGQLDLVFSPASS